MGLENILNAKISSIKKCLISIEHVLQNDPQNINNSVAQDVFVLNLQRAIQCTLDMAMALIADKGWPLPVVYKNAFDTLIEKKVLTEETAETLKKMVGFRNIAVHDYQALDVAILKSIYKHHMGIFEIYCQDMKKSVFF